MLDNPNTGASNTGTIPPGAAPVDTTIPAGNPYTQFLTSGSSTTTPGTGTNTSSGPTTTPAATSSVGSQINTPTAATSPYYYQQIVIGAKNVTIGSVFAQLLDLAPGTYSGGQIMQAYMDMPLANAVQLQTLLNNAGYYTKASSGAALQRQQAGDLHSVVGQDAMALAINDAVNQNGDMSQIVTQAAASGVGTEENAQALAPQIGGGNTYQINPISRDTAQVALQSAFQSALGRNPTEAEINNFVSAYNQQLTGVQAAQNAQKESMAQTTYQAQIASRDVTHGITDIPPATGIPAATDPYSAASAILAVMGIQRTASNIQAVAALINATGGFTASSTSILGMTPPNSSGTASLIEAAANLISNGKYEKLNLALAGGNGLGKMSDPQVQGEVRQLTNGATVKAPAQPSTQAYAAAANSTPPVPDRTRTQNPSFMGPLPSSGLSPALAQAAASNPQVASYLTAQAQAAQTAQGTPLQQTNPGQQLSSPGDTYIAPTTQTQATPPSVTDMATVTAETGANRPAYLGNLYDQFYQMMTQAIANGPKAAG